MALFIAPDSHMREQVLSERKTVSIREGWRDYRPGLVMLCCSIEPWAVMADIIGVRHCLLKEVIDDECRKAGFLHRAAMLEGEKKFYSDLDLDSPVTVIRWTNVRGKLVDDWRLAKAARYVPLETGGEPKRN